MSTMWGKFEDQMCVPPSHYASHFDTFARTNVCPAKRIFALMGAMKKNVPKSGKKVKSGEGSDFQFFPKVKWLKNALILMIYGCYIGEINARFGKNMANIWCMIEKVPMSLQGGKKISTFKKFSQFTILITRNQFLSQEINACYKKLILVTKN